MGAWLRHFFFLIPATFRLGSVFVQAWFYWKTTALARLPLPPGRTLEPREYRRWRHYFFGTTFLAAVFCQLRGRNLSRSEQDRFATLAALASLFDDHADGFQQAGKLENPETLGARLNDGGLALHLLREIYALVPPGNLPAFKAALKRVFQLEMNGPGGMLPAQLEQAAMEKGGYSVLLFWYLLDEPEREHGSPVCRPPAYRQAGTPQPLPKGEGSRRVDRFFFRHFTGKWSYLRSTIRLPSRLGRGWGWGWHNTVQTHLPETSPTPLAFVLQFGGFVQLCDDCFDVWFDRRDQTVTLATHFLEKNEPEQLYTCLERQLEQVAFTMRQLPRSQYRCESALRVAFFLAGVVRVCLRHYSQLKKKGGTLPLDVRRDMVVDMAQWRNRWLAFLEILKFYV